MNNVFITYVLYSEKYNKIYVGHTSDIDERFKSHNESATKGWTVHFRPWKIIHCEQFDSRQKARQREKQLKTSAGRRWIRKELLHK